LTEYREASELDPGKRQFRALYERLSTELKRLGRVAGPVLGLADPEAVWRNSTLTLSTPLRVVRAHERARTVFLALNFATDDGRLKNRPLLDAFALLGLVLLVLEAGMADGSYPGGL
jgi:hypothetical protein